MTAPATSAPPVRDTAADALPGLLARSAFTAGALGLVLGLWCRSFTAGSGGKLGATLADFGAPWILAAFVAGAIVAVGRPGAVTTEVVGTVFGGMAGAGALVIASFAYYGETTSQSAVYWAGAGVLVGGLAGLAGATWRARPTATAGALAAGCLGLALAAEGMARLGGGWWLAPDREGRLGAFLVVLGGMALPVLLTRGRPAGWVASLLTLLLAVPAGAAVVTLAGTPGLTL